MEELKLAISNGDVNFVRQLFATKIVTLPTKQSKHETIIIDELSEILIPADLPAIETNQRFIAVKTKGDGNCLYNAASQCITDNETLASDLRYLCAAELYVNASFYANLDAFGNDGEFGMSLTGSAENVLTSTNDRESAISHEALETCCIIPRPKWSSLIHIAALSSELKRPVYSVYPSNTGFPYRYLFHQQFNPRDCALSSDQPIYILWSVDGGLPNGPFTPNHFVSICLRTSNPENKTLAEKNKKRTGNLTDYFAPKRTKPGTVQSDENAPEKGKPQSDENAPEKGKTQSDENTTEKREPFTYLTDEHRTSSTTAPGAELIVESATIPTMHEILDSRRNQDSFENEQPNQPRNFKFPKRPFGKKTIEYRSFQPTWFHKFIWIHYDETLDKAYCHLCQTASRRGLATSSKNSQTFIATGYTNWNDANRGFMKHEQSDCHLESVQRLNLDKSNKDISIAITAQVSDLRGKNRSCLLTIISNLKFLGRQGLPLRGRADDSDSNFNQLNVLRCEDNQNFREWLLRKSEKYTSPEIQNELLKIMSQILVRGISEDIRNSLYYALMADETTDVSNREQLVICIRWIDELLEVHEDFIGLYQIDDTGAKTISDSIQDVLLRLNISLSQCRGQTYDGASAMSGQKTGVQKRIKDQQPKALYNHCHGHRLNLACSDSIKRVKIMCDALDTTQEITKLVKKSPQRDTKLEKIRKAAMYESEDDYMYAGIRVLCPTRWTVKADAMIAIINNYESLKKLWEWSLEKLKDTDMKARVRGVDAHMQRFDFFGLILGECLLRNADNLSAGLQTKDLSAAEGKVMALKTVKAISLMRTEEAFSLFWQKVITFAEQRGVDKPCLPRHKRMPARLETGNAEPYYHETPEGYFRQIYLLAIDHMVNSITDRFDTPDFDMYVNAEQVLIKCIRGDEFEGELHAVTTFYGDDFQEDNLRCQLRMISANFESDCKREDANFADIVKYVKTLSKGEKVWLNEVVKLIKLVLVMPTTNATSERSFSSLRRMKSYLRSTMKQERLNSLMFLNVHKDKTDGLNIHDVAREFVFKESRYNTFGEF